MKTSSRPKLTKTISKVVIASLVILVILFYGIGGLYFSGQIDKLGLNAKDTRQTNVTLDLKIAAVTKSTITLAVNPQSLSEVSTAGVWGLIWNNGYGQITTILAHNHVDATRSFRIILGTPPKPGQMAAIDSRAFPGNPRQGLGLNFSNVYYRGPLGNYPAWLIPAKSSTWAITVHGNGMTRRDGLKILPVLHQMGLPVLMITYRNDLGAPASKSGLLRYGLTEWKDLQASVTYALQHGAKHIVLVGLSMGGGIVTNLLLQSPLRTYVSAVILDAPMLNFSQTVDYEASELTIPGLGVPIPQSLTDVAKWIAGIEYGVKWSQLDYLTKVKTLTTPILLFQGLADKTVPPITSSQLAVALPKLVTYITTPNAGHLESWNLNPTRYNDYVRSFLTRLHI